MFAIKRAGTIANKGAPWHGGDAILVSRGRGGAPADGPSFGAAVSGDFHHKGRCIAFLSAATNLVGGDTNAAVDAFLVKGAGKRPLRISRPRRAQSALASTAVAVSGDCSRASFVIGGELYTRAPTKRRTVRFKHVAANGPVTHLSYATGDSNTLAFDTPSGVYLSSQGSAQAEARRARRPPTRRSTTSSAARSPTRSIATATARSSTRTSAGARPSSPIAPAGPATATPALP